MTLCIVKIDDRGEEEGDEGEIDTKCKLFHTHKMTRKWKFSMQYVSKKECFINAHD